MKNITVFCGSSFGNSPIYEEYATLLGRTLAQQKMRLIYGGANVGLMGALADGALAAGGEVVGVLPYFLQQKEIAHPNLTELVLVDSMHERKARMHDLSDAFIALPGGYGTFEELFEIITWGQLGLHEKPIGLLNINGFYDHLNEQLVQMVESGFLKEANYQMLLISDQIDTLLQKMNQYQAPKVSKWLNHSSS